ncbi:MAG: hypothetical protein IKZ48_00190 [Prevotella sp.]|nr:hypothetical protein [Prevotella sp.]
MKTKKLMMMTLAALAFAFGVCSCGSDDDEPDVAVAAQVAGSYTGEGIMTVMGEVFNSTPTYVFEKATDVSLNMTIPATSGGSMNIPALLVKNITLNNSNDIITGRLDSYTGTVNDGNGASKSYTVTDLTAIFKDKAVVVSYTLKYGNMPFTLSGQFTGTKK